MTLIDKGDEDTIAFAHNLFKELAEGHTPSELLSICACLLAWTVFTASKDDGDGARYAIELTTRGANVIHRHLLSTYAEHRQ